MRGASREEILAAVKAHAKRVRGMLYLHRFEKASGISRKVMYARFLGGWFALLEEAGLKARASKWRGWTDEDAMATVDALVRAKGRFPTWAELNAAQGPSTTELFLRYKSISGLWTAYRLWRQEQGTENAVPGLAGRSGIRRRGPGQKRAKRAGNEHARAGGATGFGRPLGCRGVAHEPTNELGVVHLFGALCESLGFTVTRMGQGFPDCEAMRCSDPKANRWERVRIEIEFRSSSFLRHGHDVRGCDLIVCWEHDWPRCPLEVIELRKVFGKAVGERAA